MTESDPQGKEAEDLLKQAREDPYDWDVLGLEKLLDLWGFVEERVEDAQGWEARFRYHVEYPDLNVVLYPYKRVSSSLVQLVVRLIDKVIDRRSGR